jgi:two-component system, chemotaxis family, sensor kinase CheA
MEEQDDIVKEFIVESTEALDILDRGLVQLEDDPHNLKILNEIFRTVHTIKGTCGFLEFKKLEHVAHVGENLLDSIRGSKIKVDVEIISALLSLGDAIRTILLALEQTGTEGDGDFSALVATMTELNNPDRQTQQEDVTAASPTETTSSDDNSEGAQTFDPTNYALLEQFLAEEGTQPSETPAKATSDVVERRLPESAPAIEAAPQSPTSPTSHPQGEDRSQVAKAQANQNSSLSETSLRVDVNLLDQLMNLVGELVLARNQILQFTKTQTDSNLVGASQRLNLITSELQEGVMKTRMQPIATVWDKFPRVVRDVARACGKQVRLEMEGKDTDLDKTIIEAIKDPLTHIVRNSIDHGVEPPDVRIATDKNPEGRILLRAFHEGGCVIIEVSDDGRGLQKEKILSKALERGLIRPERAQTMTDKEIFLLIFQPGFSTADQVTNISGRGVGMDVVRSNIEKIGGVIDISSTAGKGTSMRIRIPLTLAIVPVLMVGSAKERIAIPQVNLVELLRVTKEQISRQVEEIQGALYCRLRGSLLPLVFLNSELSGSPEPVTSAQNLAVDSLNIVVVTAEGKQFGLVVEAVFDTEEIVVKPLGKQLKDIEIFAGATILGDGRVALILDIADVARRANIFRTAEAPSAKSLVFTEDEGEKTSLLLVLVGEKLRLAIPLELVSRLEEFSTQEIELAAERPVVQYRGTILPLIDLAQFFGCTRSDESEFLEVIVFQAGSTTVGLIVDRIIDIVEQRLDLRTIRSRPGVQGTAVIQKKVTDVLDIAAILRAQGIFDDVSVIATHETSYQSAEA